MTIQLQTQSQIELFSLFSLLQSAGQTKFEEREFWIGEKYFLFSQKYETLNENNSELCRLQKWKILRVL